MSRPPMPPVPPRLPTLDEFRKAIARAEETRSADASAKSTLATLHGDLLEYCRWEMARSAMAYAESANAQSDYDMRRAAKKLTTMWRSWDARGSDRPLSELLEEIEALYQDK